MNGSRAKVCKLLANPEVTAVVVWHCDRLGRMNTELVLFALLAHGRRLSVPGAGCGVMSEWVSLGVAGQRLGVSGGDIRRAGYTKVTVGRLGAWEHQPPAWLRQARARKRRPPMRRAEVSCCVCGTVREVRPGLVEAYTYLVCGPCSGRGQRPEVPNRSGMILVCTVNVAGYFDGYVHRIATAGQRASVHRAAALARAAFLGAPREPES